MATLFFDLKGKNEILKQVYGTTNISIEIAKGPKLEDLIGELYHIFLTSIQTTKTEINQFFIGFDDKISTTHFGQGLGQIIITGLIFPKCVGGQETSFAGHAELHGYYGEMRGKEVTVTVEGSMVRGYVTALTMETSIEEELVTKFRIELAMTHNGYAASPNTNTCLEYPDVI